MKQLTACIFVLSLSACGSGGGSDDSWEACPVPGISLYCSGGPACCPDGYPYVCSVPNPFGPDQAACYSQPCNFGSVLLDYCGEQ